MHYFGDVFHTFLDLESEIYLAVNGTVTSLPVFIQNIFNCVQKTKKAFTGLERHGGKVINDRVFILGGVTLLIVSIDIIITFKLVVSILPPLFLI